MKASERADFAARVASLRKYVKDSKLRADRKRRRHFSPERASALAEEIHAPGLWRTDDEPTVEGRRKLDLAIRVLRRQLDPQGQQALTSLLELHDARMEKLIEFLGARACEGPECGELFVLSRKDRRFCSDHCRRRRQKWNDLGRVPKGDA